MKLLTQVVIDDYVREVTLSDSQRAVYWEWNGVTIKAKSKKLLQKFIGDRRSVIMNNGNVTPNELDNAYGIGIFKGTKRYGRIEWNGSEFVEVWTHEIRTKSERDKTTKYLLYEKATGDLVISNANQVGTARIIPIKGQDIYSNPSEFIRAKIINTIKDNFTPIVAKMPAIKEFPIIIRMELHDTIKSFTDNSLDEVGIRWDVDNRCYPYAKAFPDLMMKLGKIPDDDRLHITGPPQAIFVPIPEGCTRRIVFKIFLDEREVITKNIYYTDDKKNKEKKKKKSRNKSARRNLRKVQKITLNPFKNGNTNAD